MIVRPAAKVVLVDPDDHVLLFRGGDPARPEAGSWWFTPGGGIEPGETAAQAGRREVVEETGLELADLGSIVHHRSAHFSFEGKSYRAEEDYFIVRVDRFEISTRGWTAVERNVIEDHRWWDVVDLSATREVVYPENLVQLVADFRAP